MKVDLVPAPQKIKYLEGSAIKEITIESRINPDLNPEAYRLKILSDCVYMEGGSERGIAFAKSTLEQITFQSKDKVPMLEIEDEPAFSYRAFHIDCARHFFPVEELKKMIYMASLFKLNSFHWHFSNDQGWRIECKRFPLLHEIGSVREGDHFGKYHSDEKNGGYYTRKEVSEIVTYCQNLGIEVVPELDMPGHVTAILAAYPQFSCQGTKVEVQTKPGIFHDIFCAGREETFQFIEELLDDLLELFPGRYFHIGGDEAPKSRWNHCPACQERMKKEGLENVRELQGYMANRVADYLKTKGREIIVWNEAALGKNLNPDAIIQLWIDDKENSLKTHLDQGGRMILSNMKNCYCDYPYGGTPLESVYSLNMVPEGMAEKNILGTECLIWTEYIRDGKTLETLSWPRFAASAEVGWCGNNRPGYESFCERLRTVFPMFAANGIEATKEEGWKPEGEELERQLKQFKLNFTPEILKGYKDAMNEI